MVLPSQPLELRHRTKHAECGRVRSRNICFGHMPVAVRQGKRRDAAATGEEQNGRCAAGKSKYIRLHPYSGKLALALMNLRRARVAGHTFAASAQPLTQFVPLAPAVKNNSAWASGGPAGGGHVAACLGRRRALSQRAARREVQKPKPPIVWASNRSAKFQIFVGSAVPEQRQFTTTTRHQNPEFYVLCCSSFYGSPM